MTQSADSLHEAISGRISECRRQLQAGNVDLSGVEDGVRAYCEAVAALPSEQRQIHKQNLVSLMQAMEAVSSELAAAQLAVHAELDALDRIRQASAAYKRSDTISDRHIKGKKGTPS